MLSKDEFKKIMADVQEPEKINVGEMTLEEFVTKHYYPDLKTEVRENTMLHKEQIFRNHIFPAFGDMLMKDITVCHIRKWKDAKMDDFSIKTGAPYSDTYLWTMWKEMTAVFSHAVKFYYFSDNPCTHLRPMGEQYKKGNLTIWTKEQYELFHDAIDDVKFILPFDILFWTGMRQGEMFALKVRDYNPAKGMFSVQQSYQKLKGKDVLGATKTEAGTRNVMLQDFLVREMDDYLLVHRDISFDDRIFADVNKQSMFRAIHRYAKIAGIPEIHVHCLRHSHVSMLKNMGFPLYEIGKRVGHNSIEITNHYAHVNEEVQKPMIEELNKLIEE